MSKKSIDTRIANINQFWSGIKVVNFEKGKVLHFKRGLTFSWGTLVGFIALSGITAAAMLLWVIEGSPKFLFIISICGFPLGWWWMYQEIAATIVEEFRLVVGEGLYVKGMGRFLPYNYFYSEEKLKNGNEDGIVLLAKRKIRVSRHRAGTSEWHGEGSDTWYFELKFYLNNNDYDIFSFSKSDHSLIVEMVDDFNELYKAGGFKQYYRKKFKGPF